VSVNPLATTTERVIINLDVVIVSQASVGLGAKRRINAQINAATTGIVQ
jgi:hypothetical protein